MFFFTEAHNVENWWTPVQWEETPEANATYVIIITGVLGTRNSPLCARFEGPPFPVQWLIPVYAYNIKLVLHPSETSKMAFNIKGSNSIGNLNIQLSADWNSSKISNFDDFSNKIPDYHISTIFSSDEKLKANSPLDSLLRANNIIKNESRNITVQMKYFAIDISSAATTLQISPNSQISKSYGTYSSIYSINKYVFILIILLILICGIIFVASFFMFRTRNHRFTVFHRFSYHVQIDEI